VGLGPTLPAAAAAPEPMDDLDRTSDDLPPSFTSRDLQVPASMQGPATIEPPTDRALQSSFVHDPGAPAEVHALHGAAPEHVAPPGYAPPGHANSPDGSDEPSTLEEIAEVDDAELIDEEASEPRKP